MASHAFHIEGRDERLHQGNTIRGFDAFSFKVFIIYVLIYIYIYIYVGLQERFQFNVPNQLYAEKWVMESLGRKWKEYRHHLKNQYFDPSKTEMEIARNVPEGRSPAEWEALVHYWFSEKGKVSSHPFPFILNFLK